MGVSALVITYNEENNIRRCLESLTFADEVVVVDSYSTDRTVEIAKCYTDKVFQREFKGFSDQRNAALKLAANDWVFIVDADEAATPELGCAIRKAIETDEYDGYRVPRLTFFWTRRFTTAAGTQITQCGLPAETRYTFRLAVSMKVF